MFKKAVLLAVLLILSGCAKLAGGPLVFLENNTSGLDTYVNDTKGVEVVLCEDLNNNSVCDDAEDDLKALEEEFLEEKEKELGGNVSDRNKVLGEEKKNKIDNEESVVLKLRRSPEYLNISSLDENLTMWRIPKFTKIIKFYPNASISFGGFSVFYEKDDISKKIMILEGVETLDFYSVPLGNNKVRVFLGDKDEFYVKTVEGWFVFQVKSLGAPQFSLGLIRIDKPEEEYLDSGIPKMFDY